MHRIESRNNNVIKNAIKLQKSAKKRKNDGLCVIEGARLCRGAVLNNVDIVQLFFTQAALDSWGDLIGLLQRRASKSYMVSQKVMSALSDTATSQGIVCVCATPQFSDIEKVDKRGRYIILENISDPGNMGTIIRTADALGLAGAILSQNCCDIFSPKVLRASMGSVFRLPAYLSFDLVETVELLKNKGIRTFAAVPFANALPATDVDFSNGSAVAVGNEANGLSQELIDACGDIITIPMKGNAESLNAAVAASILMWEQVRRKP